MKQYLVPFFCFILSLQTASLQAQCTEFRHFGLLPTISTELLDQFWGGSEAAFESDFEDAMVQLQIAFNPIRVHFYVAEYMYIPGGATTAILNADDGYLAIQFLNLGNSNSTPMTSTSYMTLRVQNILDPTSDSFIHEMGHTFTLLHTFFTAIEPAEWVVRPGQEEPGDLPANCDYTGDRLCGTGGTPGYTNPCHSINAPILDANGDDYYNLTCDNFMSYSQTALLSNMIFTSDQYEQMNRGLETRGMEFGLINSNPPYNYRANFGYSFDNGCTSQTTNKVAFTNMSEVGPDFYYTWEFGDGQTSSETDPTHTYASSGEYSVTLTVTSNDMTKCHSITRNVRLTTAYPVSVPYENNFESQNSLNEFSFDLDIYNDDPIEINYYQTNNHALTFAGKWGLFNQATNRQTASICVDATDLCKLGMSFDFAKYVDPTNPLPSDDLEVSVNGTLVGTFSLVNNNQFQNFNINLDNYIGGVITIEFSIYFEETAPGYFKNNYFIDNLVINGDTDCGVELCTEFEFVCYPENYYCIETVGGGSVSKTCGCRITWTGPNMFPSEGECKAWWTFPEGTVVWIHIFQCDDDVTDVTFPITINYCPDGDKPGRENDKIKMNALNLDSKVDIYPNPNDGKFTIENNTLFDKDVRVVNSIGQVVYQERLIPFKKLEDISIFNSGIYFVEEKFLNSVMHVQKVVVFKDK